MEDDCKNLEFANYVTTLKVDLEKIKRCIKLSSNTTIKEALQRSVTALEVVIASAEEKVKKSLE